ncbi:MAG TPA: hypothetical protein VFF73_41075 [Planctomycetota bacterium]|nr:hypothetical protein [Planctomycetota bacterium]
METLLLVLVARKAWQAPFNLSNGPSIISLRSVRWRATVPLLLRHDHARRVGEARDFVLVPRHGITCLATIEDQSAARVVRAMLTKDPLALRVSCGFGRTKASRIEHVPEGQVRVVNGRRRAGPIDVHFGLRIDEVSIVPDPRDPATRIFLQPEEARSAREQVAPVALSQVMETP